MAGARKTNRRQFLRGESAVEALGDLTHGAVGEPEFPDQPSTAAASTWLVQVSRWLMACEWQCYLPAKHPGDAPEAAMSALDVVEGLEQQLSVYREDSELSRLNSAAHLHPVQVESNLFDLLTRAETLWQDCGGAFDITGGPLARVWGFHERQGRVPDDDALAKAMAQVGMQHVTLDSDRQLVTYDREGVEINLGAIGKGYALDRAASRMFAEGVYDFLFHGGRSSVIARGSRIPAAAEDNPWTVSVRHPLRPERQLGVVALRDRAMSTSGSATQSFQHRGQRFGHILDPRTGRPAEGVLSATVIAPDAELADALSTAFYVMGPEEAEAYCSTRPEIAAILILPGEQPGAVNGLELNCDEEWWTPSEE